MLHCTVLRCMHCITTVLFGVALHCVEAFAAAEPLHWPQVRIYQPTWVHTMVMITMIVMIVPIIMQRRAEPELYPSSSSSSWSQWSGHIDHRRGWSCDFCAEWGSQSWKDINRSMFLYFVPAMKNHIGRVHGGPLEVNGKPGSWWTWCYQLNWCW